MTKIIKKFFNYLYLFHKVITKKTNFGLTNMGLIFILVLIIFLVLDTIELNTALKDIYNNVFVIFLFCFVLLFLPYNQLTFLILKKDRKNKRMKKLEFCSTKNYFFYCMKTSIFSILSISALIGILFKVNSFQYLASNINFTITLFYVFFSVLSVLWFSYLIIYKLLNEQLIEIKLNLYIAIASTINLLQVSAIKECLFSFGIILVSYRWVNYIMEENKYLKRNGA